MPFALQLISITACVTFLLSGCSTQSGKEKLTRKPIQKARRSTPPQSGIPINPVGATVYFQEQTTHLLQQGKVATNLLRGIDFKTCRLDLAPAATLSAIALTNLAKAVEMGVVAVGQVVRMEKGPPQLLPVPASGFFLTESGALVTCLHLLDSPVVVGLVVMTRDGRVCPVRDILAVDAINDLVILQVEGQGFTPLPLSAVAAPQGASVSVLSHPQWRYYTLSSGIVSGYFTAGEQNVIQMQVTSDFAGGSSGAPAFNERGEVVGIAKLTQCLKTDMMESKGPVQMTLKVCTPSSALLNLIKNE